eukprot:9897260-Ditylum_brightwellii.AAC.1
MSYNINKMASALLLLAENYYNSIDTNEGHCYCIIDYKKEEYDDEIYMTLLNERCNETKVELTNATEYVAECKLNFKKVK